LTIGEAAASVGAMRAANRDELSPLLYLDRVRRVYAGRTAVVDGTISRTYAELGERCDRLAAALLAAGVAPGDRVSMLAVNRAEVIEAHFGVPRALAILNMVNSRLAGPEVRTILEHARPRLLLLDPDLREIAADAIAATGVRVVELGEPYEDLLASADPAAPLPDLDDENRHITLNYTSGTTGQPKGVLYTHRGGYVNALGEVVETGLTPDSRYLWTLPMFHCNGWCFPWAVTAVGATHVCIPRPDPAAVWHELAGGVTHLCAAPTVLIGVVGHPDAAPLERPLTVTTAGAPPSPTLIGKVEALGARVVHVYGLTETYGPFTICAWPGEWDGLPDEDRHRAKARQGVPYVFGGEVRVVDADGVDVPADGATMGEVLMRGNGVMAGYFEDPAATEAAFAGGWFHSGDAGVMHPDGYVELRDRFKDVIVSGGENISTIEIEQALARHPAVLEVAVVGIPHERWGERPKAFVTLAPGAGASAQELVDFARTQIARFKVPDAIEFCELPKTSTGKIQKFVLRDREWAGRERRIN
jgi:acyl-CoA synthetase (AMP-forming)/AMP-acid ligase II